MQLTKLNLLVRMHLRALRLQMWRHARAHSPALPGATQHERLTFLHERIKGRQRPARRGETAAAPFFGELAPSDIPRLERPRRESGQHAQPRAVCPRVAEACYHGRPERREQARPGVCGVCECVYNLFYTANYVITVVATEAGDHHLTRVAVHD